MLPFNSNYSVDELKKDIEFSKIFTSSNAKSEQHIVEARKNSKNLYELEADYYGQDIDLQISRENELQIIIHSIWSHCPSAIILDDRNAAAYFISGLMGIKYRVGFANVLDDFMKAVLYEHKFVEFFNQKIAKCTEKIKLDPMNFELYKFRAIMYLILNEYKAAINDCHRAYEFCQKSNWQSIDEIKYLLSVVYFETGHYKESINLLDDLINGIGEDEYYDEDGGEYHYSEEDEDSMFAYEYEYYLRGQCYAALSRFDESEKDFRRYRFAREETDTFHYDRPVPSFGSTRNFKNFS